MSLRHALLGLLAENRASGYDLLKLFDTSLANVWPATQSQIYTELTKLATAGLIAVSTEGPRGRKEYALTDDGRAELRHWLTETEPKRQPRGNNDLMLRVFFLGMLPRAEARDYLQRIGTAAGEEHERLTQLRDRIDWTDADFSTYGRLVLEFGRRFAEMRRDWAEWAAAELP